MLGVAYSLMYSQSLGVEKNEAEALKWYTKAAQQGNADAQYELGLAYSLMYDRSLGVEKNEAEAVKWLKKAAQQGNTAAQEIIDADGKIIKWYTKVIKAAEQGDVYASYRLGQMYYYGDRGVEKNDAESVKCYTVIPPQN